MNVLSVVGITQSGKTTTAETIIRELKKRRFTVGSVKDIHYEEFAMDTEGTNTHRHYKAGAELVTARGIDETDLLFKKRVSAKDILKYYNQDFVVLEGVTDFVVPTIITAHTTEEIEERLDETVFLISGRIADEINEYKGIPVIHPLKEKERLVKCVMEKVFPALPNIPVECCGECGMSCKVLLGAILRGEKNREDCSIEKGQKTELKVGGEEIMMVPFVQTLLKNAVMGVVKALDNTDKKGKVEVVIRDDGK